MLKGLLHRGLMPFIAKSQQSDKTSPMPLLNKGCRKKMLPLIGITKTCFQFVVWLLSVFPFHAPETTII